MAVPPPAQLNQQAWDYLLDFTFNHEALVLCMYNNRTKDDGAQDVTCGIGIRLPDEKAALAPGIRSLFYNPNAPEERVSDDQLKDDWKEAAKTTRVGNVKDNLIPEYAAVCKLRIWPEKAKDVMAQTMKNRLADTLRACAVELAKFDQFPVQGKIACASFNYGYYIHVTKNMKRCLQEGDFDGAGRESWLKGISPRKVVANRTLFWNAARIIEQKRDYNELPLGNDPPSLIPWQPMGTGLPRAPDSDK
jgi:hypothetical protein